MGVTRPLPSEVGPSDGAQRGSTANGSGAPHLLGRRLFNYTKREQEEHEININKEAFIQDPFPL